MKKKREGKKKKQQTENNNDWKACWGAKQATHKQKKRERYQMVWVRAVGCTGDLSRVAIQLMAKGGRPQERGKKNH